jgi:hypothetical protein
MAHEKSPGIKVVAAFFALSDSSRCLFEFGSV